jgi:hypothetical protein
LCKLNNAGQFSPAVGSFHLVEVFQMSSLEQRLAAITGTAANLKAQLFELERLREQIGKALLSAEKIAQPKRRNGRGVIPLEIDRDPAGGHRMKDRLF